MAFRPTNTHSSTWLQAAKHRGAAEIIVVTETGVQFWRWPSKVYVPPTGIKNRKK
jgi:hypothetical protein